jgi:hypothetical protein
MLTVKYIDLQGNETVFATQEVRYVPNDGIESGGHVWFDRPDGKAEGVLAGVSCGSVFVMNEAGKTVATYRLGDPSAKASAVGITLGAPDMPTVTWSAGMAEPQVHS